MDSGKTILKIQSTVIKKDESWQIHPFLLLAVPIPCSSGFEYTSIKTLIQFQYSQKRFLWNLNCTDLFHSFLSLFLFFKQLTFTGDIATITFGRYIFTNRLYRFAGNNLGSDSRLDSDIELLPRNQLFHTYAGRRQRCCPYESASKERPPVPRSEEYPV